MASLSMSMDRFNIRVAICRAIMIPILGFSSSKGASALRGTSSTRQSWMAASGNATGLPVRHPVSP